MATQLIQKLLDQKVFDVFIQENMKQSTYKAEWKDEISQVDYCASKAYNAYLAETQAAIVGSVIEKNAEKPIHGMPSAKELVGTIGRMGDKWQMDNDRLDQYYYLQGRYNDKASDPAAIGFNEKTEKEKLIKFLFEPFEVAAIAPHKRLDMLYFEGLFQGTQTVSRSNNGKANVSYTYPLGVTTFSAKVAAWGNATATPIDDIQDVVDYCEAHGKEVRRIRMSKKTFRKMSKSDQFIKAFTLKLGKVDVKPAAISVDDVNAYLESISLPTITVEKNRFAKLADGADTNLTPDDRVVFQCAERVAVMKIADPLEAIDKLPNKVYSSVDDNLVGHWRGEGGRFYDYEMWATPVFTGKNDYFILKTDVVEN